MRKSGVVQQPPERFQSDTSLPDVLVAVELRTARRLGVIAMPHANILESHGRVQVGESSLHSRRAHEVVAGNMNMAGVDAGSYGHHVAQKLEQFGNLLKAAAQGIFGAGS